MVSRNEGSQNLPRPSDQRHRIATLVIITGELIRQKSEVAHRECLIGIDSFVE